jgi:hypothetical protein
MSAYDVTINATYLGQPVINSLGFRGPGDVPAGTQAQDLARRVRVEWLQHLVPLASVGYILGEVQTVSITNPEIAGSSTGSNTGAAGSLSLTGAICAAVDILTGFRGRSFRGRTGICGLTENHVDGNNLVETSRAQFETAVRNFRQELLVPVTPETEIYELGVVSRIFQGVKRPVPIFTAATAVNVRARVGTRVTRLR